MGWEVGFPPCGTAQKVTVELLERCGAHLGTILEAGKRIFRAKLESRTRRCACTKIGEQAGAAGLQRAREERVGRGVRAAGRAGPAGVRHVALPCRAPTWDDLPP